jgi:hypothetical protein
VWDYSVDVAADPDVEEELSDEGTLEEASDAVADMVCAGVEVEETNGGAF